MVTLEWDLDRTDGVTFVRVYVAAERPRRVRVENRLDGSVWPPRRRGQRAAGWDEDGFEGVVTPDERLVAGYATPAPPTEPPVELVRDDPAETGAGESPTTGVHGSPGEPAADGVPSVESTPAGVVRTLGDPTVPRDAVPMPDSPDTHGSRSTGKPRTNGESPGTSARCEDGETGAGSDGKSRHDSPGQGAGTAADRTATTAPSEATGVELVVPGPVRAWMADVERRVAAVERRNGVARSSTLGTAVADDRRALARVAARVGALADRVEEARVGTRHRQEPGHGAGTGDGESTDDGEATGGVGRPPRDR